MSGLEEAFYSITNEHDSLNLFVHSMYSVFSLGKISVDVWLSRFFFHEEILLLADFARWAAWFLEMNLQSKEKYWWLCFKAIFSFRRYALLHFWKWFKRHCTQITLYNMLDKVWSVKNNPFSRSFRIKIVEERYTISITIPEKLSKLHYKSHQIPSSWII